MEKYKAPISIKVIWVLNEIIFYLFVAILLAALIFSVIIWSGGLKDDMQLHINLPIEVSSNETGLFLRDASVDKVRLVEMTGSLHLIDTPHELTSILAIPMLFVISAMFYMLTRFRKLMSNVKKGLIFIRENIMQIRIISLGLFIIWVLTKLYAWLLWIFIGRNLRFGTLEVTGEQKGFVSLLFISLFLWVLSHIFMQGLKLQEENNLTI